MNPFRNLVQWLSGHSHSRSHVRDHARRARLNLEQLETREVPAALGGWRLHDTLAASNLGQSSNLVTLNAAATTISESLWTTANPAVVSASDANAVELGVKFRANIDGAVS